MGKVIYSGDVPLLEVENPKVGALYHMSWAKNACVWRLKEIKGEWVKIETPKTKKEKWARRSDLRHTRKTQSNIEMTKKIINGQGKKS